MMQTISSSVTIKQLIDAAAANHTSWFKANAVASGGSVHNAPGITWIVAGNEATITFPFLDADSASATLDAVIHACRERQLERIACWSLSPPQPHDLGVRLAARGFEWGWRPHWMALDLSESLPDLVQPDGVTVTLDDGSDRDVDDLPYYERSDAARHHALSQARPRQTWHFVARRDGAVVGHATLHVMTGRQGFAGIYNVGVVPAARHLGIGSQVSQAACRFARDRGCSHALLNSAADALYFKLGFRSLGYGQTWWMHTPALCAFPPPPEQIAFAEAVGRGDTQTLDTLPPSGLPDDLNAPLLNGMTPMEQAVRAKSPAGADWLIARGVPLDLLEAWDLYGESRAREILQNDPPLVNRLIGDWKLTPLHEAVQRDDVLLARFLLKHHPDTSLQDSQFNGTALGWARHLNRAEIAALLEPLRTEVNPDDKEG